MSANPPPVLQVPAGVDTTGAPAGPPAASGTAPGTPAPLAPQRPGTAPRRGSARGIPAAPTALAALNATAVAGSAVSHAFGPVGGVAAAGAALIGAALLGSGKAKSNQRKAARSASVRAARQNGSALGPLRSRSRKSPGPSGGSTSSRSARSGSGKHRSPTSPIWRSTGSTPGSTRSTPGSGRRSGPGKPGRTRSAAGSSPIGARTPGSASGSSRTKPGKSGGSAGSTTRSGRTAAGSTPGSAPKSSLARRAARGLIKRSDGSRRQPIKTAKNVARAVKTGATKIGRGTAKAWKSKPGLAVRRVLKWSARQGWRIARTLGAGAWAAIGRKGWRGILRAMKTAWDRKKETGAETPATPGIPGSKVTMPTTLVGGPTSGARPASTGGGISMAQARFNEAAAEMFGAAMVYNPDGMMQVGQDFAQLPEAFRNIAGAMQTMAKRAHDNDPLHDAIIDIMYNIYQKLHEAAKLSEDLAPAFRSLHAVDIKRIESPRRGEEKWDLSANRDHAGRSV